MFAPKVAKAQTKPAASPTDRLSTRRSLSMHRQFGNDHERGAAPENMDAREAPRGLSWDFSRISMSPPDRADRPQMSSPLRAFRPAGTIRPKLVVGRIDDPLEHEADQVADQVMRPPGPQPSLDLRAAADQSQLWEPRGGGGDNASDQVGWNSRKGHRRSARHRARGAPFARVSAGCPHPRLLRASVRA